MSRTDRRPSTLRSGSALGLARAAMAPLHAQAQQTSQCVVPAGFQVDVFADNVENAEVRVLREGLPRASGVTLVGDSAVVLVELTRAVVIPYQHP